MGCYLPFLFQLSVLVSFDFIADVRRYEYNVIQQFFHMQTVYCISQLQILFQRTSLYIQTEELKQPNFGERARFQKTLLFEKTFQVDYSHDQHNCFNIVQDSLQNAILNCRKVFQNILFKTAYLAIYKFSHFSTNLSIPRQKLFFGF